METVAERITNLRKEKNLSRAEFSKQSKISLTTISFLERGRKPTVDILIKIADFYDVSVDYLLLRTDEKKFRKLKRNQNQFDNEYYDTWEGRIHGENQQKHEEIKKQVRKIIRINKKIFSSLDMNFRQEFQLKQILTKIYLKQKQESSTCEND